MLHVCRNSYYQQLNSLHSIGIILAKSRKLVHKGLQTLRLTHVADYIVTCNDITCYIIIQYSVHS